MNGARHPTRIGVLAPSRGARAIRPEGTRHG